MDNHILESDIEEFYSPRKPTSIRFVKTGSGNPGELEIAEKKPPLAPLLRGVRVRSPFIEGGKRSFSLQSFFYSYKNVQPPVRFRGAVALERSAPVWWKDRPSERSDTISVLARVDPKVIGLLNSLVDSYDGVACMRTTDPKKGYLEFWVPPDRQEEFQEMMANLREVIDVRIETQKDLSA